MSEKNLTLFNVDSVDSALSMADDSMEPTFMKEDFLYLKLTMTNQRELLKDNMLACWYINHKAVVGRQYVCKKTKNVVLKFDNDNYPPCILPPDAIMLGVVIGYFRMFPE